MGLHCWLRLRRHSRRAVTSVECEDRGVAIRTEMMAPGLVPPEVLAGIPRVTRTCNTLWEAAHVV